MAVLETLRPLAVLLPVLLAGAGAHRALAEIDLGETYRATLDHAEGAGGRDWRCGKEDVWSLRSFRFASFGKLSLALGPSSVVFGRHGTNVVWAAVIPEKPGRIERAPEGTGERVTSIFLRFHPALVKSLFPPRTVRGSGAPEQLIPARRIYQYKINASWQHDNLPVVPWKHSIVLDCETVEGTRRFYSADTRKRSVQYQPAFARRRIPEIPYGPLEGAKNAEVFDRVWNAFDREYAMFVVKPAVDWKTLKAEYRPLAERARGRYELAAVIAMLLAHLEDLHVAVKIEDEYIWCYSRFRPLNASWEATRRTIGKIQDTGKQLGWGKTRDNIGYIIVRSLTHPGLPDAFDGALEELEDTRGLILDLRFNGGGDENLARSMAGRFIEAPTVYSSSQYRDGAKHTDLTKKYERLVHPRGDFTYEKPVAVLCGQRTMSSAESFVCMLARSPRATLIGDRTAGSSANPRRLELPGAITVHLPRWLDRDHTGKPIDAVGVQPEITIKAGLTDFTASRDPVLDAGLKHLRSQQETGSRK